MNVGRNVEIDYLRAYAVALVVALHLALIAGEHIAGRSPAFTDVVDLGAGVDIFFVISGYVVYGAFERLRTNGLQGASLYATFLFRRLVRLWPASAFWLFYCLAGAIVFIETHLWPSPISVAQGMLAGLAYLYNFEQFNDRNVLGYFWSLSIEWQFYVVFPLLVCRGSKQLRLLVLAALILLCCFWRPGGSGWWMFRFDGLLFGMLLYEIADHPVLQAIARRLSAVLDSRPVLRFALSGLLIMEVIYSAKYIEIHGLSTVVSCAFAFALVFLAAQDRRLIFSFLPWQVTSWLGLRSYSIYLAHIPIALTVLGSTRLLGYESGVWTFSAVSVAATLVCAELSYRWLEVEPQRRIQTSASQEVAPRLA